MGGNASNISGDTDVATGALFDAVNLYLSNESNATVNGVIFSAAAIADATSDTFSHFRFKATLGFLALNDLGSSGLFFTSLSPGYQSLLSSAVGDPAGLTLTISNLTVMDKYEFEWRNKIPEAQTGTPSC